jgi:hypothetical protein
MNYVDVVLDIYFDLVTNQLDDLNYPEKYLEPYYL